jgi:putative transposase
MLTARKQEAVLTVEQDEFGKNCEGIARAVWNAALGERQESSNRWRASRRLAQPNLGWVSQAMALAETKKDPSCLWLKEAPAVVLQQTLMDLDKACRAHGAWRVKYRAKHRPKISFRYPAPKDTPVERLNRKWGRVYIPKFGWIRFRWTRPLGGHVRNVTLKQERNRWFVVFLVETGVEPPPAREWTRETAVGVDVGVVSDAVTSEGVFYQREFTTDGERARIRRLEQKLARQRRTNTNWRRSKRYRATKTRLQTLRDRQTSRRSDFHHKVARELTLSYTLVCNEKLNIKNMTKSAAGSTTNPGVNVAQKRGLNRSILDKAWGSFYTTLRWHALKNAATVQAVPASYTSQECPTCHHTAKNNRESQAVFLCQKCGYKGHADVVGAVNILERGIKLAPDPGLGFAGRGDLGSNPVYETLTTNKLASANSF